MIARLRRWFGERFLGEVYTSKGLVRWSDEENAMRENLRQQRLRDAWLMLRDRSRDVDPPWPAMPNDDIDRMRALMEKYQNDPKYAPKAVA